MKTIILPSCIKKSVLNTHSHSINIGILIVFTLFFINFSQSQTLEFSQVKLVKTFETVPQGKVWKIENMLPTTRLTSTAGTGQSVATATTTQSFKVDNVVIYYATSDSRGTSYGNGTTGYTSSAHSLTGPIWLPEGTTLEPTSGIFALSVIEFTVIP